MDAVLTAQAWDFHCLLCLLLLHANGQIPPNEWAGIRSLHRRLVFTEKSLYTMEETNVFARKLKLATESDVSEEEILELVFGVSFVPTLRAITNRSRMHQNKLGTRIPVLKCPRGVADATLPFFATNGVCIDPFLADKRGGLLGGRWIN